MSHLKKIGHKICRYKKLISKVDSWKESGDKIVFTNGCFDIIHKGHIELLARSADLGEKLIVGLNSDNSIQKIKGKSRPIIDEDSRALLLAALSFVDAVILFSEETPIKLITDIKPDILAKGGDYEKKSIIGHDIIKKNGGEVIVIPYIDGFSSTNIINKIKKS